MIILSCKFYVTGTFLHVYLYWLALLRSACLTPGQCPAVWPASALHLFSQVNVENSRNILVASPEESFKKIPNTLSRVGILLLRYWRVNAILGVGAQHWHPGIYVNTGTDVDKEFLPRVCDRLPVCPWVISVNFHVRMAERSKALRSGRSLLL